MQLKTFLSSALAVAMASAQASNATAANLTALLGSNDNLSALTALINSDQSLATALGSMTNVTLFAPSNDALNSVMSTLQQEAGSMPGLVQALLQYHVLSGEYYASNISSTPAFPHTLLNDTAYSNVTGGQVVDVRLVGQTVEITTGLKAVANVTQANLNYTGGVVHIIDSVLTIPENCSATAAAANLTALAGALEATNLTDTVNALHDVTIFAPSNDAFQAIASATGNLTTEQLAGILEYHVINGTVAYSSSLGNGTVTTLSGQNVTITIEDGDVFINSARVINPDVLVAGGVIHIIDSVLNPNATSQSAMPSMTAAMPAYSGASSEASVPFTSGIPAPTSTNAALATTMTDVASGYTPASGGGAVATSAAGGSGGSSSSSGIAAAPTGAIGAAALFGGAALVANW